MRVTDAMFMATKKQTAHDGNPLHLEMHPAETSVPPSVVDLFILL